MCIASPVWRTGRLVFKLSNSPEYLSHLGVHSSVDKRICLQYRRPRFDSWVGKIRWRRNRLPTPGLLGFPCGSAGKDSACNAGDLGSIPGLGRSPGEGKGYLLQYSYLENSMDCIVHGFAKSRTRLSDLHFQECMMEDTCLIMVLLNVKLTFFSY